MVTGPAAIMAVLFFPSDDEAVSNRSNFRILLAVPFIGVNDKLRTDLGTSRIVALAENIVAASTGNVVRAASIRPDNNKATVIKPAITTAARTL